MELISVTLVHQIRFPPEQIYRRDCQVSSMQIIPVPHSFILIFMYSYGIGKCRDYAGYTEHKYS